MVVTHARLELLRPRSAISNSRTSKRSKPLLLQHYPLYVGADITLTFAVVLVAAVVPSASMTILFTRALRIARVALRFRIGSLSYSVLEGDIVRHRQTSEPGEALRDRLFSPTDIERAGELSRGTSCILYTVCSIWGREECQEFLLDL